MTKGYGVTTEDLLSAYHATWDEAQREYIKELVFEKTIKLGYFVINAFRGGMLEYDDLIGCAHVGLFKAFTVYDVAKGVKFSTFAAFVIRNEVLHTIRRTRRHIGHLPLDKPISDENSDTFLDKLEDTVTPRVGLDQETAEMYELLQTECVAFLSEREYLCLLNLLAEEPLKQRELAEQFGVTQSIVSRIIRRAREKVYKYLVNKDICEVSMYNG